MGGVRRAAEKSGRNTDVEFLAELIHPIVGEHAESRAADLITSHKSVKALIAKIAEARFPFPGLPPDLFKYLKTIAGFFAHLLEREVLTAPVMASSQAVHDYLFHSCASLDREQFRVLFLDGANRLISDRIIAQGSVNRVDVHLRDIVITALDEQAAAMILVHNHPSGDPTPSKGDIALTNELIGLCRSLDIKLHEHLIVARSGVVGLRDKGYVP